MMTFTSILFLDDHSPDSPDAATDPAYFRDLNLDQFVSGMLYGRDEYRLRPFFQRPLQSVEAIRYRQDIMRDLEEMPLRQAIETFTVEMRKVRTTLARAEKLYYALQKERQVLEAIDIYCGAIACLDDALREITPASAGIHAFRDYLSQYRGSSAFGSLEQSSVAVVTSLSRIQYSVVVHGGSFRIRRLEDEEDYSRQILTVFDKFRQADARSYLSDIPNPIEMNHVEAQVLEYVSKLFPEEFSALDTFVKRHSSFQDDTLVRFDREIQFYLAYDAVVRRLSSGGLSFCYPSIEDERAVSATAAFDVALAVKLQAAGTAVVTNDLVLGGGERILLVSGPNQGGKTTFARTFGQLHFLGCLGLRVPGTEAKISLFDEIFTHFEREEHVGDLRGKLEDELVRIHEILQHASPRSIVIMNEIFASTTLDDATTLAGHVLYRIMALDLLCVCVTFLNELVGLGPSIVSMVTAVTPDTRVDRTFKIERRPPDGRSYAMSLAEKYRLVSPSLDERLARAA